jgi:hypothetical protein
MKIKLKDSSIIDVQVQQYEIGLYVCIYKEGYMLEQFGLDTTKEEFMQAVKNNEIFEGEYISENY